MQPLPGIRIRRLRLAGVSRNFDVDFTQDQRVRDLSVVAGAFSSGKTAVLEFIAPPARGCYPGGRLRGRIVLAV